MGEHRMNLQVEWGRPIRLCDGTMDKKPFRTCGHLETSGRDAQSRSRKDALDNRTGCQATVNFLKVSILDHPKSALSSTMVQYLGFDAVLFDAERRGK